MQSRSSEVTTVKSLKIFLLLQKTDLAIQTAVKQQDVRLLYLRIKFQSAPLGSSEREEAEKELSDEINHRKQIDQRIIEILQLSLNQTDVLNLLTYTRTTGKPLVDDDRVCFKTLINSFETNCGAEVEYGMKYIGALANICNMGVDLKESVSAIKQVCSSQ